MAEAPLDPQELDAIQRAVQEAHSGANRPSSNLFEEVVPLALIADDRAAEVARPAGMRIAERWATNIQRRLRYGDEVSVKLVGAETV